MFTGLKIHKKIIMSIIAGIVFEESLKKCFEGGIKIN
jgi:hypothetical protein